MNRPKNSVTNCNLCALFFLGSNIGLCIPKYVYLIKRVRNLQTNPRSHSLVMWDTTITHSRNLTTSNSKNEPSFPTFKDRFSLEKFLKDRCKSGNFTPTEALCFFDSMIKMQPAPRPASSFNILFGGLAKGKQCDTLFLLYKRLNSVVGLLPDCLLVNCFCKMGRMRDGFVVFGRILTGYIVEAIELFHTLRNLKFELNVEAYNCLIDGLCKSGRLEIAWKIFHSLLNKAQFQEEVGNPIQFNKPDSI